MFKTIYDALKQLRLGIGLLIAAGAILLMLDLNSRNPGLRKSSKGIPRVAIVQHASIKAIDDGRIGLLEQFKSRGFTEPDNVSIKVFNAEGDIGTANAIAKDVVSGAYDLIITISTPSLQTVASANKSASQINHVFGLVTDPYAAGVGIDPSDHTKHPAYMTGFGSMQPIESLFVRIKEMRAEAKRIGLVWNPAESNSFAQTKLARELCKKMDLELIEGSVENAAAVQEAVNSVISRGVDLIWISGDITVSSASSVVIRAASNAGIPVFSSLPSSVMQGSLLDLGADYVTIGRTLGQMACDVLEGKSPASIPVENQTAEILLYNETVLSALKERWTVTSSIKERADGWITATENKIPPQLVPKK
ncbi:MAG: ABC transporter substrate-binding protein [Planctomycetaceae bacterium]|jgi:putative ABC transport system substrate-binding protein|nr:ABC transporter substrate-binding protein [Planctomycetaceae bacterium]MCE2815422.1 ABC transporter substrate-binding protein [Planctomycetaceae bacterium]